MSDQAPNPATMDSLSRRRVVMGLKGIHMLATVADQIPADSTVVDIIESCIYAMEALNRVDKLADEFDATDPTVPSSIVARAFATEIRAAIRGTRE